MNAYNTPGSPERTAQRLNQAIVDLVGDQYFGQHPFFFVLDGYVDVCNEVRLAEVLEDVVRQKSDAKVAVRPQADARTKFNTSQLSFDFGPDFNG